MALDAFSWICCFDVYFSIWLSGENLPAMQEKWVESLIQEDTLKEMPTHSSNPAWEIPWTEEPDGL